MVKGVGRKTGGRSGKKTSHYPMKKRCSFCKKLSKENINDKFYCKFHIKEL